MAVRRPLTREDLRDELRLFAVGTLAQDLPDIVSQVREELRAELHLCFLEWSPQNAAPEQPQQPPQPRAHIPCDGAAERTVSEDPEGAPPQSLEPSPGRLPDEAPGHEAAGCEDPEGATSEGLEPSPSWRLAKVLECKVEDSPVDSQADTEASPRPAYRLEREVPHASPSQRSRLSNNIEAIHEVLADQSHVTNGDDVQRSPSQRSNTSFGRSASQHSNNSANTGSSGRGQVTTQSAVSTMTTSYDQQGELGDSKGFFKRHYKNFTQSISVKRDGQNGHASRRSRLSTRLTRMVGRRAPPPGTGPLARLVNSGYFDYGTGLLILLNAAAIGFQTDYMARHMSTEVPPFFRGVELFFCAVFTIELLLRLGVHRLYFFCSPDYMWNMFDMVLVVLQLTEETMALVAKEQAEAEAGMNTDFSEMRILRILRLIRIIRLVRILRLIGELRTIVVSIAGSLRSLCWTVLLLMMMMYLVGVYMTQLILDYRTAQTESAAVMSTTTGAPQFLLPSDGASALTHYFGSLGMAMISLYQAITGGLNWHMLVDPMMSQISPWLSVLIGLYIAFSLFALMNVVTGVFVESALATAKSDRDMFLLQFVRKLFQEADKDQSGAITWDEFKACLGSKEMQMYFEAFDLDIHEAKNLFQLLDINGSGEVDFEEFVNGCFRLRGSAKALDLATFMSGFSTWNEQWVKFAKRVDWQLRTLMKAQGLSMMEAPQFKSRRTSVKAPCGGMTLPSPDDSDSEQENGSSVYEAEMDNDEITGQHVDRPPVHDGFAHPPRVHRAAASAAARLDNTDENGEARKDHRSSREQEDGADVGNDMVMI